MPLTEPANERTAELDLTLQESSVLRMLKGLLFDHYKVYVSDRATKVGGSWCQPAGNGELFSYDSPSIKFFFERLCEQKNPTFLDIGANTGSFCLLPKFTEATCIAFEPLPAIFEILKENLTANNLEQQVVAMNVALSERGDGEAKLNSPQGQYGLASFGKLDEEDIEVISVKQTCIDDLVKINQIGVVDLIKIDTEGFELPILRGAKGLLKEQTPDILLEYSKTYQCGYSPIELERFLEPLGYECFLFSSEDMYFYHKKKSKFSLGLLVKLTNWLKLFKLRVVHSNAYSAVKKLVMQKGRE